METIAVLFGMEQSFPPALVEAINRRGEDVRAEFLKTGGIKLDDLAKYTVIIDRISQDIPFYRAMLKHAALNGTRVINNPFWWSADDKFFNYSLAHRLGVAVPKTAILPSKEHPPGTSSTSMRNLVYPLNWDELFGYVGFPAWLKPFDGGGWKHVYKVHNADEFFDAYHQTGDLCMVLQEDVEFEEYYRCYVIGRKHVHIMPYEPRNPMHLRYQAGFTPSEDMARRITEDCLTICNSLGYDMNTVEFAVRDGIPYAIDYMNPAPDAEKDSVGEENFNWMVETLASYAIEEARKGRAVPSEYRWSAFLTGPNAGGTNGSTAARGAAVDGMAGTPVAEPIAKSAGEAIPHASTADASQGASGASQAAGGRGAGSDGMGSGQSAGQSAGQSPMSSPAQPATAQAPAAGATASGQSGVQGGTAGSNKGGARQGKSKKR